MVAETLTGDYHDPMPSARSSPNGSCKVHPDAPTTCRLCLMENLQEFRHANVRQGLRLASGRIVRLRDRYAALNGAGIGPSMLVAELGMLLTELAAAEDRVAETPVDPSAVQHVRVAATKRVTTGE